jgi:hypothetical protein
MSTFLTEPVLRCLLPQRIAALKLDPKWAWFELTEDLHYDSSSRGLVVVEKGTITNLASIPPIARPYINPDDPQILGPSVVHDADYANGVDRELADATLKEGTLCLGMRSTKAALVHRMVRIFGGKHWRPAIPLLSP